MTVQLNWFGYIIFLNWEYKKTKQNFCASGKKMTPHFLKKMSLINFTLVFLKKEKIKGSSPYELAWLTDGLTFYGVLVV